MSTRTTTLLLRPLTLILIVVGILHLPHVRITHPKNISIHLLFTSISSKESGRRCNGNNNSSKDCVCCVLLLYIAELSYPLSFPLVRVPPMRAIHALDNTINGCKIVFSKYTRVQSIKWNTLLSLCTVLSSCQSYYCHHHESIKLHHQDTLMMSMLCSICDKCIYEITPSS